MSTATQTYLIGSVTPPDTPLTVNAQTVTPWRTGGFICMVKVVPGTNTVVLRAGATELRHTFRTPDSAARPDDEVGLRALEPVQPLGVYTGENVRLVCRAPAGRQVFAAVGERTVPLVPDGATPSRYTATISFPAPTEDVPVVFYADGLADAPAASITACAAWPAHTVTGPLFAARAVQNRAGRYRRLPDARPACAGCRFCRGTYPLLVGRQAVLHRQRPSAAAPDVPLPPRDLVRLT